MTPRDHIIFVCTANICRSPMAERLLAHGLAAEGTPLDQLKVASAGISAYTGDPASVNSVKALNSVGLDLADHRSQQISQELLDKAFAVFCMTQTHRSLIEVHFEYVPKHLYLMRELMPEGSTIEIPDPFGRDLKEYEACRDSMVEAIPSLLAFLRQEYPSYVEQSS